MQKKWCEIFNLIFNFHGQVYFTIVIFIHMMIASIISVIYIQ